MNYPAFDLDGVFALPRYHRHIFRLACRCNFQALILWCQANAQYLGHRPPLHSYILTARPRRSALVTRQWLNRHEIFSPVIHAPDHLAGRFVETARWKAWRLRELKVSQYWDDNPSEIRLLNQDYPECEYILFDGRTDRFIDENLHQTFRGNPFRPPAA